RNACSTGRWCTRRQRRRFVCEPARANRGGGCTLRGAYHVLDPRGRCRRRARELRHKHNRWISPGRRLHGRHPKGRDAAQPAGLAAHESGAGHQSQDRQGARLDDPASAARPRRRGDRMRRREFITLLGGAAAAWPLAAGAPPPARVRRIGVLLHSRPDAPGAQGPVLAFLQGLSEAGWAVGRNLRIDYRWSVGTFAHLSRDAAELVALNPETILAGVGGTTTTRLQATRTVPIVFAQGIDPVGNGYVESLAQPGGNATGFMQFEYSLAGKWLELLKEVAP